MNSCPDCGAEFGGGDKICPGCGRELAPAKKPGSVLPKALHPFAVMGYLLVLSGLLVFLQFALKSGKIHSFGSSESASAQAEDGKGLLNRLSGETPVPRTPADKQYVNVLAFERKTSPVFAQLAEIDAELGKPGYQISDSRWQEMVRVLNDLSAQAENLLVPPGLGPCKLGVRNSLDQARGAVNSLRSYQQAPTPELKSNFEQSLALSRSQRNYCQSLIELVKKKLSPDLTLKPEDLERAAREQKDPLSAPPAPLPGPQAQPASPNASPQPSSRPETRPSAPGINYPADGTRPEDVEGTDDEDSEPGEEEDVDEDNGGDEDNGDLEDEGEEEEDDD